MGGIFQAKMLELLKVFRQGNMKCLRWWKGSHRVVVVFEFVTESKETEKRRGGRGEFPWGATNKITFFSSKSGKNMGEEKEA